MTLQKSRVIGVLMSELCLVRKPTIPKFSIISDGLHDIAEIKGHRRTYVGAMLGTQTNYTYI